MQRQPGRLIATWGVGVVAATAAVISFTHVQHLAHDAGESEVASLLLPLSVDGAVAAAVAVILAESNARRRAAVLAWVMLMLGLAASLAANIASAQPTWTARAVAAWPPIALALGVEVLAGMVRRARVDRKNAPIPGTQDRTAEPRPKSATIPAAPRVSVYEPRPMPTARQRPAVLGPGDGETVAEQLHLVSDQARASTTPVRVTDQEAIELIRRLDAEDSEGQASRRTIETALRCGASRATRLIALARPDEAVPDQTGPAAGQTPGPVTLARASGQG